MRGRLARWYLLFSFALVGLAAAPATHGQPAVPAASPARPPQDMYLFVELWTHVNGTGSLPMLCIDFPGYTFDSATGRLARFYEASLPPLLPSDWGFAGSGQSRAGAAGCGVASYLTAIARLPYTTTLAIGTGGTYDYGEQTRAAPVELLAVDAAGTLEARIDGELVTLAPGERWSKVVGADLRRGPFDGHYEITSSVTNYGWRERAEIDGPTQFAWLPMVRR